MPQSDHLATCILLKWSWSKNYCFILEFNISKTHWISYIIITTRCTHIYMCHLAARVLKIWPSFNLDRTVYMYHPPRSISMIILFKSYINCTVFNTNYVNDLTVIKGYTYLVSLCLCKGRQYNLLKHPKQGGLEHHSHKAQLHAEAVQHLDHAVVCVDWVLLIVRQ